MKRYNTTLIPDQGIEAIMREIITQCTLVQRNRDAHKSITDDE